MAVVTMAPGLPDSRLDSDLDAMSTLPDPRSPLTSPELSRSNSTSLQHPDLSNEVTTLSNKLIRAINHQTDLDDTLVQTRYELSEARQRIEQLEAATAEHHGLVTSGELVPRTELELQKVELMSSLAHEQKQRGVMEKDKRGMEQELESLTTALFEEANQVRSLLVSIIANAALTLRRWSLQHVKNVKSPIDGVISYEFNSTIPSSFWQPIRSNWHN